MRKQKIILYAVDEPASAGVVERYELANVYGLEYIRAFALENREIKKNYDITISVFPGDVLNEEVVDLAARHKPEMAGFTCSLKNHYRVMDFARQIKLASPDTKIIIGGPEAFAPDKIMAAHPYIDYAAVGEGEETFRDLLLARISGKPMKNIQGLCFRKSGKIIRNKDRKPIENLDILPRVVTSERAASFSDVVLYETSRGCRHSCAYCLWSPYPKRYFDIGRVKKDLKAILSNKNVTRIWFIDSDFDSDPKRASEILRFVKANNPHKQKISAFLSFTTHEPELLALVSELFFEVPVGLQTVDGKIMKALGRLWFDIKKFERALPDILRSIAADRLYIDLMYGLPHETLDAFFDSLLWCVRNGLCHINFFRLGIYPGTTLHRDAHKYGYVFDPWPPHLVYSSATCSYSDILEIENAITNFKILTVIFGAEGMAFLEKHVNMRTVLENIDGRDEEWETHFTRINESNISGIDAGGLLPRISNYLSRNVEDRKVLKEIEARIKAAGAGRSPVSI